MQTVKKVGNEEHGYQYWFMCPGCDNAHCWDDRWVFDKNYERPTISPSLLVRWTEGPEHKACVCHSFINDGTIQFLSDCTHELAGQSVPIPELPEWLKDE